MKKLLVVSLIFWLAACSNDAAKYGEAIMPGAQCDKFHTSWLHRQEDTAICTYDRAVYLCSMAYDIPKCSKERELPAEVPPVK